jgi:phage shock protein A
MDDTDLSGLDLDSAKEYIFAYAVDVKRLEKEIAEARQELERWKGRQALAEGKLAAAGPEPAPPAADPMAALAEAARSKAAGVADKLAALEAERADLRAKINRMREQLPIISSRERSIDPDRLLAELQMMTGELLGGGADGAGPDSDGRSQAATEADFAKLEADAKADSELEALRRRAAAEAEGGGAGDKP